MATDYSATISAAVEGDTDEAVLGRLVRLAGGELVVAYGKSGKPKLRDKVRAYNQAARNSYWIVLVDLDHDFDCAPELSRDWLPAPSRFMSFRVAVRSVESWLLADRDGLSRFLGISKHRLPDRPDLLDRPKRTLVDLARRSRRREIREDMAPRDGSGRETGPAYNSRLMEFVQTIWQPDTAEESSPSLRGCRASISELLRKHR